MRNNGSPLQSSLIFFLLVLLGSCAKNVGHEFEVVKTDQSKFASILSVSPYRPPSVLAKASAVSSLAEYVGSAAQVVQESAANAARDLGYSMNPKSLYPGQISHSFCHETEPGRSMTIYRESGKTLVMFQISGWKEDQDECPGASK